MENKESNTKEITLDKKQVNLKSLLIVLPLLLFFTLVYSLFWKQYPGEAFKSIIFDHVFLTIAILCSGIVLHEFIHGLFWSFFVKGRFKSIKFGISWSSFTPYCHCVEPIKLKYYRLGAIMPGIILGFIPSIISWFTGSLGLLLFGLVFCIGAGSDLLMIWLLRNENRNLWVQDNSDKIGCTILKE